MLAVHGIDTPPRTFWEGVSRTRWGRYLSTHEQRGILAAAELAGPPSAAMEVGCEGGRWSALLHDLGWQLTCTDVTPESIDVCRERIPDATCILVSPDDERLPAEDGAVRLLLTIEVAPVLEATWYPAEAARVLEPGGVLFAVIANGLSARAAGHHLLRLLGRRARNEYGPSFRTFRDRLAANGIDVVEAYGLGWAPFTRASNSPLIPIATRLEQALGLRRVPSLSPLVLITARRARR